MFDDYNYDHFTPKDIWNEVLPRNWNSGVADDEMVGKPEIQPRFTKDSFGTVVTLRSPKPDLDKAFRSFYLQLVCK